MKIKVQNHRASVKKTNDIMSKELLPRINEKVACYSMRYELIR